MAAVPRAATDLSKQLNYEKFVLLFTNQHTKDMHDRQVSSLQRVCRHNPNGFAIMDLPHIQQLVELALGKVQEGHSQFIEPVNVIIGLCGNPFISRKANEKVTSADAILSMLNLIGSLLLHSDTTVQLQAVNTLRKYAQGYGCDDVTSTSTLLDIADFQDETKEQVCANDLRLPTRNWNQQQLSKSGCTSSAIESFLRETDELFSFDKDKDGQLSREEMHQYKILNDGVQNNDSEEYDADAEARREDAEARGETSPETKEPPHFLVENIDLLLQLSYSAVNALAITQSPVPSKLMQLLYSVQNFREPFILKVVEIASNLMDHTNEAMRIAPPAASMAELLNKHRFTNAVYLLGTHEHLSVLRVLLERVLVEGYRQTDKELRNDILVVCSKLAARPANHEHFVTSGLVDFALLYGTAAEMKTQIDGNVRTFSSSHPVDFEFKRLVWSLISMLLSGPASDVVSKVANSNLAQTLLSYIDLGRPDTKVARSLKYSEPQTNILRDDALSILFAILRRCPDVFTRNNGHKIILDFAKSILDADSSAQSQSSLEPLRNLSIRVLNLSASVEGGASRLAALDAIPYFLDLFADQANSLADRGEALRCLTSICADETDDVNQAVLRRAKGIQLMIEALRHATPDAQNKVQFLCAVVDCIWDAVVGNKRSEARLLVNDGVDALLDLLDSGIRALRNRTLGCLADLARNPKSHHYFRIWKSDRNLRTLSAMLCAFHKEEEIRLGAVKEERGVIKDVHKPLRTRGASPSRLATPESGSEAKVGKRLRSALQAAKSGANAEPASSAERRSKAVLSQDLRAKIFALLNALDFDAHGVSTGRAVGSSSAGPEQDDEQKQDTPDIPVEEQIFLRGLREYAEFRRAAAWQDVKAELSRHRVNPIYPDSVYLESRLEDGFNIALAARSEQRSIRDGEDSKKADEESAFHDEIKHRYEQARHSESIKQNAKATRRKAMFN